MPTAPSLVERALSLLLSCLDGIVVLLFGAFAGCGSGREVSRGKMAEWRWRLVEGLRYVRVLVAFVG